MVSHDHRFLNNVCTHIIDVDYERAILYTGNYDGFVEAKKGTSGSPGSGNPEA